MVKLATLRADNRLAGFHTEEFREAHQRRGFRLTTRSGQTGGPADVAINSPHRVGRYGVDIAAFESPALPGLARPCGAYGRWSVAFVGPTQLCRTCCRLGRARE
ncbi:MAG: nucleoside-triphosphatase [Planctomycetaceae bacterium]